MSNPTAADYARVDAEHDSMPNEWRHRAARAVATLRAYDALDAAPEPTLLEAAKACEPYPGHVYNFKQEVYGIVERKKLDALKAAVEREEGKR